MLRPISLLSPFVLAAVVSCGESSTLFDEVTGGSAGSDSSSSGGSVSQGGSAATAGTSNNGGGVSNGGVSAGGSNNKAGSANGAGTNNNGGGGATNPNPGGGTSGSAGINNDAAGSSLGGGTTGAAGMGAGGDGSGARCPDIFGEYDIRDAKGTCNGLNKNAAQSIQGTDVACFAHFVSDQMNGAQGVNGGAALDADGNFTGANLSLDGTPRGPCNGTWTPQSGTMTVKCGGGGPGGDLCTVVLERR